MDAGEDELREDRAEGGEGHVFLGVPDVALGAEEGVAFGAAHHGDAPFEELVGRAEGEADGDDDGEEPAAPADDAVPDEDLAREDRGHEPLGEVADAVVVVAREAEPVLHPETERHAGVRVVTAHDEDDGVHEHEHEQQGRERKAFVRRDDQREPDDGGEDLEAPREPLVGPDHRPGEDGEEDHEQCSSHVRTLRCESSSPRVAQESRSLRVSARRLALLHSRLPGRRALRASFLHQDEFFDVTLRRSHPRRPRRAQFT